MRTGACPCAGESRAQASKLIAKNRMQSMDSMGKSRSALFVIFIIIHPVHIARTLNLLATVMSQLLRLPC